MKKHARGRPPAGWSRIDGGVLKTTALYEGPGGFLMQHCGHPTARTPYTLYGPVGGIVRAGVTLDEGAAEVERRLSRETP